MPLRLAAQRHFHPQTISCSSSKKNPGHKQYGGSLCSAGAGLSGHPSGTLTCCLT